MIIKSSIDKEAIKKVFNNKKIFKRISDDCYPCEYEPTTDKRFIYLLDDTESGVVKLEQMNGICCQSHIALLPVMWGKGIEFVEESIRWVMQNTVYVKTITMIPVFNRLTIKLVKNCGFHQEGLIKKSFLKNWKLHDQAIFGLTKYEFLSRGG